MYYLSTILEICLTGAGGQHAGQKIALELFELEALKIANMTSPHAPFWIWSSVDGPGRSIRLARHPRSRRACAEPSPARPQRARLAGQHGNVVPRIIGGMVLAEATTVLTDDPAIEFPRENSQHSQRSRMG